MGYILKIDAQSAKLFREFWGRGVEFSQPDNRQMVVVAKFDLALPSKGGGGETNNGVFPSEPKVLYAESAIRECALRAGHEPITSIIKD